MPLIRWDRPNDLFRLRNEFDRMFERAFRRLPGGPWEPSVDFFERGNELVLRAELPGVDPKDVDVTVTEDSVILKGELRHEDRVNRDGYYHSERRYGTFARQVALPAEVRPEAARADFRNGILEVTIPKTEEARARSFKVPIKRADAGGTDVGTH